MGIHFETVSICVSIIKPVLLEVDRDKGLNKKDRSMYLHEIVDIKEVHSFFLAISTLCREFNQPYSLPYDISDEEFNKDWESLEVIEVGKRILDVAEKFLEARKGMGIDSKRVQTCVNILEPMLEKMHKEQKENKGKLDNERKDRLF